MTGADFRSVTGDPRSVPLVTSDRASVVGCNPFRNRMDVAGAGSAVEA